MLVNVIFFALIAVIVISTAVAMIVSRNAVYSALFLVLNFSSVALLYLILGAPFIALVQITVYAGSIMVLFLFVIMLLGAEKFITGEVVRGQRVLAILFGVGFVAELALFMVIQSGLVAPLQSPGADSGSPATVGQALFTQYALPFEVTGFILLVATVGAILLTRGEGKRPFNQ